MIRRPKPGETESDLMRLEDEQRQSSFQPSVKLVKSDKRKTEEPHPGGAATSTPKSKFAQDRAAKRHKEGIRDHTVLDEAVRREPRVAVVGRVVARDLPPDHTLHHWQPPHQPTGFPKVHRLENLDSQSSAATGVKKSLYMLEMERKGVTARPQQQDPPVIPSSSQDMQDPPVAPSPSQDPRLRALGSCSMVVSGEDSRLEAEKIHRENLDKIASMTHQERLREQQELLANLNPEHVALLRSLRQARQQAAKTASEGAVSSQPGDAGAEGKTVPPPAGTEEGRTVPAAAPMDTNSTTETLNELSAVKNEQKQVRFAEKEAGESQEEVDLSELPIDPSEAQKWPHMDKLDIDKLRWMTNMPQPRPLKNSEGFVARFNFEGDILPYEAEVSYRAALHHHGEEPGRAGYTLDELFILIRSQVLQQRHLGLKTLANILRNAKEGLYDHCVSPPLLHLAVEAGAVLLLRFALDDPSAQVYGEALRGLYHLTASAPDELCLAFAQPWLPAGLEPGVASLIYANDKAREELHQEEQELKDFEVIKLDIIRALLRMDTVLRLRYLLETTRPSPESVIHILGLLTRMVRHSLTAAWVVARTPRLLATIMDHFLPYNLSPLLTGEKVEAMTSVYGIPLRHALQFMRVLAAKGRQLAALLVNTYDLTSLILTYVALDPGEVSLPLQEALVLSQEAYATWAVLLSYGLTKPTEAVSSFFPMLVKQLVFYRDKVSINEEPEKNKYNYDVGAFMISVLSRAVHVASSQAVLQDRMRLNQGTIMGADGRLEVVQPPSLTWDDLRDVPELVQTCLTKWLTQLAREPHPSFSALRLIGSCCTFLSAYYIHWKDQVSFSNDKSKKKIEHLYYNVISPALSSSTLLKMTASLVKHSSLCSELKSGLERDPQNLGSLGCVTLGGKVVPVIQPSSPFPLLLPLTTLLATLHSLHVALDSASTLTLLDSEELCSYLDAVCASSRSLASQWLSRVETHFICNVLKLATSVNVSKAALYHETALCIMLCVQKGDEHLIKDLLTGIICNRDLTTDLLEVTAGVRDLFVGDYEPLVSPALVQPVLSPLQLTKDVCQALPSIKTELINNLVTKREYEASQVLNNGVTFATNGITIAMTESAIALENCWPLLPVGYAYSRTQQVPQGAQEAAGVARSDQSSPEDILTVTRCLQMAYLCLKHRRRVFKQCTSPVSWLQHLSLVFLATNDMFLDATVSSYLQGCICLLLREEGYASLDFGPSIKCFSSSSQWYSNMLGQYMGVSYGDSTFALYVIVPLQQHCPLDYRKMLWGDQCDALQFVCLKPEQVARFIPLQQFLEPPEEDEGLITKYRAALGTGEISPGRNSFLHMVATHHVNVYLQKHKM